MKGEKKKDSSTCNAMKIDFVVGTERKQFGTIVGINGRVYVLPMNDVQVMYFLDFLFLYSSMILNHCG